MQRPLVIVAESDALTKHALREMLEANGFEVVAFLTGHDAISYFEKHRAAVVIVDVRMKDMGGHEFAEVVKRISNGEVRVLLTSAVADVEVGPADEIIHKGDNVKQFMDDTLSQMTG